MPESLRQFDAAKQRVRTDRLASFSERRIPSDVARVEVDRHQAGVGRLGERDRAEPALRGLHRARSAGLPEHDAGRAEGAVVAVLDVDSRVVAQILADLVGVGFLRRSHVQGPCLWVERRPAPVCAAARARKLQRSLKARRGEERTQPESLHLRHGERVYLGSQIVGVVERYAMPRERRGLCRQWLRWVRLPRQGTSVTVSTARSSIGQTGSPVTRSNT